jgi:hypothetical protein
MLSAGHCSAAGQNCIRKGSKTGQAEEFGSSRKYIISGLKVQAANQNTPDFWITRVYRLRNILPKKAFKYWRFEEWGLWGNLELPGSGEHVRCTCKRVAAFKNKFL